MSRFGWFLLRHRSLQQGLHRLLHRRGSMVACLVCTAVWRALETDAGFVEGIRAGEADLAAGRFRPWSEIR